MAILVLSRTTQNTQTDIVTYRLKRLRDQFSENRVQWSTKTQLNLNDVWICAGLFKVYYGWHENWLIPYTALNTHFHTSLLCWLIVCIFSASHKTQKTGLMSSSSGTATFCCTPQETDICYPGQIKADSDSQQTPKGQSIKSNMEKLVLDVFTSHITSRITSLITYIYIYIYIYIYGQCISCINSRKCWGGGGGRWGGGGGHARSRAMYLRGECHDNTSVMIGRLERWYIWVLHGTGLAFPWYVFLHLFLHLLCTETAHT